MCVRVSQQSRWGRLENKEICCEMTTLPHAALLALVQAGCDHATDLLLLFVRNREGTTNKQKERRRSKGKTHTHTHATTMNDKAQLRVGNCACCLLPWSPPNNAAGFLLCSCAVSSTQPKHPPTDHTRCARVGMRTHAWTV